MTGNWTEQTERSNRFFLVALVRIALVLGRGVARGVLRITVLYYLLTAPGARAASRDFLDRVLDRDPGWRDMYRQFFSFATCGLDRVYLASGRTDKLDVRPHGQEVLHRHTADGSGAIVIVSHLGSYEMLRTLGRERGGLRLRILMDRAMGAKVNAVLEAINPKATEAIIDTSESDMDRVLKLKAALDRGEVVGLMGDRFREGDRISRCRFLGDEAPFPLSPWLLAGLLEAPVLLAFGLYRGGNRYDLHFEAFSEGIELPRGRRDEIAARQAQAYADRLAHYASAAPYNWFNFYDFWQST